MPLALDLPPAPGDIVRVRSRRYLVEEVTAPPNLGDDHLVRLSCLEDDAEGEELQVLWQSEVDAERMSEADWSKLSKGDFDSTQHFAAYYRTLRWNTVTSTDPKTGRRFHVLEVNASRTLQRHDVAFARVVTVGDTSVMFGMAPWQMGPEWHTPIIDFREALAGGGLMNRGDLEQFEIDIRGSHPDSSSLTSMLLAVEEAMFERLPNGHAILDNVRVTLGLK